MSEKKYVVHKKVIAREFSMVEASSIHEAIEKVSLGQGKVISSYLEGAEALPKHTWSAELAEVPPKKKSFFDSEYNCKTDEYVV